MSDFGRIGGVSGSGRTPQEAQLRQTARLSGTDTAQAALALDHVLALQRDHFDRLSKSGTSIRIETAGGKAPGDGPCDLRALQLSFRVAVHGTTVGAELAFSALADGVARPIADMLSELGRALSAEAARRNPTPPAKPQRGKTDGKDQFVAREKLVVQNAAELELYYASLVHRLPAEHRLTLFDLRLRGDLGGVRELARQQGLTLPEV